MARIPKKTPWEELFQQTSEEKQLEVAQYAVARAQALPVTIAVHYDPLTGEAQVVPIGSQLPVDFVSAVLGAAQQQLMQTVTKRLAGVPNNQDTHTPTVEVASTSTEAAVKTAPGEGNGEHEGLQHQGGEQTPQ